MISNQFPRQKDKNNTTLPMQEKMMFIFSGVSDEFRKYLNKEITEEKYFEIKNANHLENK